MSYPANRRPFYSFLIAAFAALVLALPATAEVSITRIEGPIDDLAAYGETYAPPVAKRGVGRLAARSHGTSDVLLVPFFEVDTTRSTGPTTLFAVHNETNDPVTIRVTYLSRRGLDRVSEQLHELAGHATKTINVRDIRGIVPESDGIARGLVVVGVDEAETTATDVISGDYCSVDPSQNFASGGLLINMSLADADNEFCTTWSARFMNGGAFDGGTTVTMVLDMPGGADETDPPTAVGTIYDEAGIAQGSFELRTDEHALRVPATELVPEGVAFGSMEIRFPYTRGVVLLDHSAAGRYSIGLEAACTDGVDRR